MKDQLRYRSTENKINNLNDRAHHSKELTKDESSISRIGYVRTIIHLKEQISNKMTQRSFWFALSKPCCPTHTRHYNGTPIIHKEWGAASIQQQQNNHDYFNITRK